jgi:hypothetical protein
MTKKIIGDVILHSLYLKELPDILKDITVSGDFYCYNNKLTTLKGAPTYVGGFFDCTYNNLTSLIGAPTNVGGNFHCYYNKLTSLDGAPTYVGGDFLCYGNTVKFTEAQVRAVCDVKGDVYV